MNFLQVAEEGFIEVGGVPVQIHENLMNYDNDNLDDFIENHFYSNNYKSDSNEIFKRPSSVILNKRTR